MTMNIIVDMNIIMNMNISMNILYYEYEYYYMNDWMMMNMIDYWLKLFLRNNKRRKIKGNKIQLWLIDAPTISDSVRKEHQPGEEVRHEDGGKAIHLRKTGRKNRGREVHKEIRASHRKRLSLLRPPVGHFPDWGCFLWESFADG